ncbi:hypothetical protein P4525_10970 [Peribacillus psychrosaccharolyticus]|uniref:hypothetical protein n=1 Tax=Peribacillus psychrosaccharolyticus TaxID=1407 RepID=UPI002E1F9E9C|nr:hypothetical protein [Peribacillus psychrosaccharolyticus]
MFVNILGNDYLSVQALLLNLIAILSFTELGLGNAIIYSLYRPIANGDTKKVKALLNFYAKAYRFVILAITVIGIAIIPFLNIIIKDVPDVKENVIFIYLLFLTNTIISYVFSYKKSLLIADQKNYIVVLFQQSVLIIQVILQILFLIHTHNFVIFLVIQIFSTLLTNISTDIYVNKKYKYVSVLKGYELEKNEKKELFSNIKDIFFYRIGAMLLNSTDNIIISIMLKTTYVGLSANYVLVINGVNSVLMQACNGIAASIGNHNVEASNKRKEEVFEQLYLIAFWIFGISSICLAIFLNPMIELWLGFDNKLDTTIVIALVLSFYFTGINQIPSLYRTSIGLFKQAKYTPIVASVINIILSVILGKSFGLAGVFFATSIAKILTFCIVDPVLIYKKGFDMNYMKYFKKFLMYFMLIVFTYFALNILISYISLSGIIGFTIKLFICLISINVIFVISLYQTRSFQGILFRFKIKRK